LKSEKPPNQFLKYSSLGLQVFIAIGMSAWIGFKIDNWLSWKFPVFLLVFVLVSFGGMIYKLYRSFNE
jgi:hypothetical protein